MGNALPKFYPRHIFLQEGQETPNSFNLENFPKRWPAA
jgi:hypothetical protein